MSAACPMSYHWGMPEKTIAVNRRATHDYHIEETIEAGIALTGTEVKSLRAGRVSLRESYAQVKDGELWLLDMHISPYERGGYAAQEPTRPRKLLVHRNEINYLLAKSQAKGYTLVPLKVYIKNRRVKVELGLAKGKKLYDKREDIAKREAEREMERALKER